MGRPAVETLVKIRKQIIALSPEEFALLFRDMEIMREVLDLVRDDVKAVEVPE